MTPEQQVRNNLKEATKENNETEKTISLQLIGVAIFVTTVIGAFVALPGSQGLSLAGRIFLLINLVFLFLSLTFGIIHLLVVRNMWFKAMHNMKVAKTVLDELVTIVPEAQQRAEIGNLISKPTNTTMAFFYLQLATLGVGVTIFLGLIVTLLF